MINDEAKCGSGSPFYIVPVTSITESVLPVRQDYVTSSHYEIQVPVSVTVTISVFLFKLFEHFCSFLFPDLLAKQKLLCRQSIDSVPSIIKMTSVRKRGASGHDDDDAENCAFLTDSSLSKTSKLIVTKKHEDSKKIFQWITIVIFGAVVFAYSFNRTVRGRL
jgi:hypothetical protein